MSTPNDGGPAFPGGAPAVVKKYQMTGRVYAEEPVHGFPGMSLRDWFAGQALVPLIVRYNDQFPSNALGIASEAYEMADALLAARASKGGTT